MLQCQRVPYITICVAAKAANANEAEAVESHPGAALDLEVMKVVKWLLSSAKAEGRGILVIFPSHG